MFQLINGFVLLKFIMSRNYIIFSILLLILALGAVLLYYYRSPFAFPLVNFSELPNLPQFQSEADKRIYKTGNIKFDKFSITVDIADTEELRSLGLSGRSRLAPNRGMIFIFDKPGFYGFWMKDMRFPIDIIWLDENWKVIDITANAKPSSYPESFIPMSPAQYVLEVPAYFSTRHNIKIGNVLDYSANQAE